MPVPPITPEIVPTLGFSTCNSPPTLMLPAATNEVPEPVPLEINFTKFLAVMVEPALLMLMAAPLLLVFSPLMLILPVPLTTFALKADAPLIVTPLPVVPAPNMLMLLLAVMDRPSVS